MSPDRWNVKGTVLCSGYAGVLRTALSVTESASDARLRALVEAAATATLQAHEPGSRFGFPH
ncbi:hypothetical protein Ais01nite_02520 [Asanoa ishikariensis]|uniref:hypothetical protein n=1 Tax=Asanoa ishikariensis TaxID=137265 RepID=UPI000B86F94B|nr:hypothetical protein [Asanoa ishikariensis]GIF62217.1 hypothetical protein Ais01nite_02520 [Asanoa ishikariensis]